MYWYQPFDQHLLWIGELSTLYITTHRKVTVCVCCVCQSSSLKSISYWNVNFFIKSYIMNSWSLKREKTPWTKSHKKFGPKKRRKAICSMRAGGRNSPQWQRFLWMFGSLEVDTTFPLFCWLVPFPFVFVQKLFSLI